MGCLFVFLFAIDVDIDYISWCLIRYAFNPVACRSEDNIIMRGNIMQ